MRLESLWVVERSSGAYAGAFTRKSEAEAYLEDGDAAVEFRRVEAERVAGSAWSVFYQSVKKWHLHSKHEKWKDVAAVVLELEKDGRDVKVLSSKPALEVVYRTAPHAPR